jgi:hypothetical protein
LVARWTSWRVGGEALTLRQRVETGVAGIGQSSKFLIHPILFNLDWPSLMDLLLDGSQKIFRRR